MWAAEDRENGGVKCGITALRGHFC